MDLEKCKVLLKAIDCGSFSIAAAELGYTPAGIRYIVDVLEQELGFPVLKRGRSGVTLTPNGAKILPALKTLVQAQLQLEEQAFELRNYLCGELTIGTFSSIASQLMPQIINDFQQEFPGISIHLVEDIEEKLEQLLLGKQVDLCFCSRQAERLFQWIPLRQDPMLCVLPPSHPLACQKAISPHQLIGQPLIMPGYGRDPDVLALLEKFQIPPMIKYSTVEYNSAFRMVEYNLGITIANELVTLGRVKDAVVLPFDPPQAIWEGIAVPSLESASPAAKKFIQFVTRFFLPDTDFPGHTSL